MFLQHNTKDKQNTLCRHTSHDQPNYILRSADIIILIYEWIAVAKNRKKFHQEWCCLLINNYLCTTELRQENRQKEAVRESLQRRNNHGCEFPVTFCPHSGRHLVPIYTAKCWLSEMWMCCIERLLITVQTGQSLILTSISIFFEENTNPLVLVIWRRYTIFAEILCHKI